jgi:hypothetical protein
LSRTRSPITSRSNWANDNRILSVSRPMLVVGRNGGALWPVQQRHHRSLLRLGTGVVMNDRLGPASPSIGSSFPSAALHLSEHYAWPRRGSSLGRGAPSRRHHHNPAKAQRRWRGRGAWRSSLPWVTTDALFAQEVERKVSNLLAGLSAAQSFLDRTKHYGCVVLPFKTQ